MATPFPRSTRALVADGYRYAALATAIGMVLLVLWFTWFFTAEIKFWESSKSAQLIDGHRIIAEFDASKMRQIARGQAARFTANEDELAKEWLTPAAPNRTTAAPPDSFEAVVQRVLPAVDNQPGQIELTLVPPQRRLPLLTGNLTGTVVVEVARKTPAALVTKHSGTD